MEIVHERCAGIDISKTDVKVCIRVPAAGRRRRKEVRTFGSMTPDLLAMRDWLMAQRITVVGMEATGDYGSRCSTCWNTTWIASCSTLGI